jgi:hypothetical protein
MSVQAGVSGGRGGGGKFIGGNSQIFVDSNNTRVAGHGGCGNRTRGWVVLFGTNSTATLYVWSVNRQKCFKKQLNHAKWRPQQVPTNATYVSSFHIGPQSGGLSVDKYCFGGRATDNRHGRKARVGGCILVTSSGCDPVMVNLHGRVGGGGPREENAASFEGDEEVEEYDDADEDYVDRRGRGGGGRGRGGKGRRGGGGFIDTITFIDFQPSIPDPTVFTPPTYCNATTLTFSSEADQIPSIIEKFVEF